MRVKEQVKLSMTKLMEAASPYDDIASNPAIQTSCSTIKGSALLRLASAHINLRQICRPKPACSAISR